MITDTDRLNWLLSNITYMEHGPDKYAFWPHKDEEFMTFEEDKLGMTLTEYIDSRIGETK